METKLCEMFHSLRDIRIRSAPAMSSVFTYIYQEIKHPGMQGLGKCVPGVTGLLYVEGHVDRL